MSVVVYDAIKGIMAADTRAYSGTTHPIGGKMKIHRLFDGSLLVIVSNQVGMPEAFKAWLNSGARNDDVVPNEPLFDAIHVKLNGEIFLYVDGYTPAGPLHGTFFTIGSGRKYAYGALMCGKSPAEAVEITAQCDPFCGGPVAQLPLFETTCSNLQAA